MQNRLVLSRTDRWLGGVCGGLGKYLGVDANLVRVFFVLFALSTHAWFGFWASVIVWVVLPREQTTDGPAPTLGERIQMVGDDVREVVHQPSERVGWIVGGGLVVVGLIALVQNLNISWLSWVRYAVVWPVLLILAGVALILRGRRSA
jgi:phage shock protein C